MKDANGVEVEPFDDVGKFIERFAAVDHSLSEQFFFRGVPDVEFALVPSSRRMPKNPDDPHPLGQVATNARDQSRLEVEALRRFYDGAYLQGLTIPGWEAVQAYVVSDGRYHEGVSEFVGLAQHYGTPTRLLDWTLDPLVAAYFAASNFERKCDAAKEMAVWRLDHTFRKHPTSGQPWKSFGIPFDVNQNARAQRAMFMDYLFSDMNEEHPVARESFSAFLNRMDAATPSGRPYVGALTKFTLPREKAPDVLSALRVRRISASTLFPGYGGAAREERERCQIGDP